MGLAPSGLQVNFPASALVTTPPGEPGSQFNYVWENEADGWQAYIGNDVQLSAINNSGGNWELASQYDPAASPSVVLGTNTENPFESDVWATLGYSVDGQTFPRSRLIDVVEAVKDELNSQSWSQSFTAARKYLVIYDLGENETGTLQVPVAPAPYTAIVSGADRESNVEEFAVDIGLLLKVESDADFAKIDWLTCLQQEIVDYWLRTRITINGQFKPVCVRVHSIPEDGPSYLVEHLQRHQLTSVTRLTFQWYQ